MEAGGLGTGDAERDRLRVKKKAVEAVLLQCQRALELLSSTADDHADDVSESGGGSSAPPRDEETDDLCDLLKSRIECSDFLKKLEGIQASVPKVINEDSNAWDMVSENDLWEGGGTELDQEDYVFVRQEDIVEGLACFMATYLLSVKPTKDLTPNQLQEALSKTFSVKKKKGKLRKAWDGSKVIYNVASWGATAVGIYQNPVLLRVASTAFCTSCHVISKLF